VKLVSRVCKKCGAHIFADAPEGLCSACLLEKGLDMFTAASMSPDHRDDAGAAKPVRDEVMMLGVLGDYD